MQILISSLSENGSKILNKIYSENKRESLQQRIALRLSGYKAVLVSKNPCCIEITFSQKFMASPAFIQWLPTFIAELHKQMTKKGIKEIEYKVEVI